MNFLKNASSFTSRYDFIDGLKGIAVLMVLWHHTLFYFHNDFNIPYLKQWIDHGFRGVPLFFIISAFTLFNSSLIRFEKDSNPQLSFYLRRAFRILPFFWLNIAYANYHAPADMFKILSNATFVFGFIDINSFMVPGSWSLFVEEVFYATFPIFFIKFYKKISWVIFFFILFVLMKMYLYQFTILTGRSVSDMNFIGSPLNNFYWFYLGILLAHFKISENDKISSPWRYDILLLAGVISLPIAEDITAAIILCFFMYTASFKNTITGKLCRSKFLGSFGICCYSIYFIHFYMILKFDLLLNNNFYSQYYLVLPTEFKFIFYTACIAISSLVAGVISFNLIEIPSIKLGSIVISKINKSKQVSN